MLTLLRRVAEGDRMLRRREPWQFTLEFMLGESLEGKVLGIVGAGGSAGAARLAEAFGAVPVYAGRRRSAARARSRSRTSSASIAR